MDRFSAFDIVGPRMIGPSSSHTAGAVRLALAARAIAGGEIASVRFTLFGSFAHTGRGHGTDQALVAGILGLSVDDERIADAFALAREGGIEVQVERSLEEAGHPNTVKIEMVKRDGAQTWVEGRSVGGGNILITRIDGADVEISGQYPSLLIEHRDRPGVIHEVTKILSDAGINVAFMRVFREGRGEKATMLIETDGEVPPPVIEELRLVKDIQKAITIRL